jgi:N-acetylmuramoyl-L-alanine amidase
MKPLRYTFYLLFLFIALSIHLQAQVKTIVIDPGHGGKDKGSTWDTLLEKDLILDFAKYFEGIDCGPEYRIEFLRTSDEYFTLNGRVQKINELKPHCIISLHHSMNIDSLQSGVQVFYCRENYNEKASLALANKVIKLFPKDIPIINSPEHANFLVLRDVNCPGILLEIGYMTSEHDRNIILSEDYRKRVASAIIQAIVQ